MRTKIMLARPYEKKLTLAWKHVIVQPKLKGNRGRAVYDSKLDKVTLYSSQGNIIRSLPHINDNLCTFMRRNRFPEIDGEFYVHKMTQEEIRSFVGRKTPKPGYEVMQYHIFDVVDIYAEQGLRLSELMTAFQRDRCLFTRLVESQVIKNDDEQITKYLADYISRGYEGIILRNPHALYKRTAPNKSKDVLKLKPTKSDSYRIIGYNEEIDIYGSPKGALGSLELMTPDGGRFSVGSGLTRGQRHGYWSRRERLIGMTATIKYSTLSGKNNYPESAVLLEITDDEPDKEMDL